MDKISVIVPVYNVETYLRRCVDSILQQTYTNLEIILVDDGSPDNAGAICDEYKTIDNRVKVIHQENIGASKARTAGIEHATGEFIGFMDADDWCDKQMYQSLYHHMVAAKAGISCCGYQIASGKDDTDYLQQTSGKVINYTAEEFMNRICRGDEENYLWNKLYRRDVLNKVWVAFPKERFAEDMAILYRILSVCQRVVVCEVPYYYYFQNEKGICATCREGTYQSYLKNLSEMEQFYAIGRQPDEFNRYRLFLVMRAYIELCKWNVSKNRKNRKEEQQLYRKFKEAYKLVPLKKILHDKMRTKIVLTRIHVMKLIIMIARG